MAKQKKKIPTTYTYESADGSKSTIQAGTDGVTRKWISFLTSDDACILERTDYQRKHEDYWYLEKSFYRKIV